MEKYENRYLLMTYKAMSAYSTNVPRNDRQLRKFIVILDRQSH